MKMSYERTMEDNLRRRAGADALIEDTRRILLAIDRARAARYIFGAAMTPAANADDQFAEQMAWATSVVATWPEWKRSALSGQP